jgi:hypothetical protein
MLVWYQQVDNAKTAVEVVAIARDYLASWGPREISLLPQAIRPGRMRDEEDIQILHALALEEYRSSKASGDALDALQRMTSFVVRAAVRLVELREAKATGPASPAPGTKRSLAPRER